MDPFVITLGGCIGVCLLLLGSIGYAITNNSSRKTKTEILPGEHYRLPSGKRVLITAVSCHYTPFSRTVFYCPGDHSYHEKYEVPLRQARRTFLPDVEKNWDKKMEADMSSLKDRVGR